MKRWHDRHPQELIDFVSVIVRQLAAFGGKCRQGVSRTLPVRGPPVSCLRTLLHNCNAIY
jgi:hypothetical protein